MSEPALRIGTSGWNYKHWRGIFYARDLPAARWLDYYAQHFDTVEINYSFYRLPSRDNFGAWAEQVPPGFLFAVKGNRFITHLKRLRDPAEPVERFFERASALGPTFGPVLWQLPPHFHRDVERLTTFLAALPRDRRHTFEFRHDSWFVQPVYDALAAHDAALCLADRGGGTSPLEITASWTYVRFHGGLAEGWGYTDAQLHAWAERLAGYRARGLPIYAYFNNDPHGHAIADARRLRALLSR
ncbi:MAG TPA: DUF72 domain-containing protein [Chloroflexota bacterium]|jgi:uncharacterized protein YecE (DUF72 family)